MTEHVIWVEKYRPSSIQDTVLPKTLKETFLEYYKNKQIPNLVLQGPSGTGKTTLAKALCNDIGAPFTFINGSLYGNIDTLRTDIKDFCSSLSLKGGRKYVILDEADYLNPNSTQPSLRNFIEEYSKNCGFIFTLNYPQKLIKELHSRLVNLDFDFRKLEEKEKLQYYRNVYQRCVYILEQENVSYDGDHLQTLIIKYGFDIRKLVNYLQSTTRDGKLVNVVMDMNGQYYRDLFNHMIKKDFDSARKWLGKNSFDQEMYGELYQLVNKAAEQDKIKGQKLLMVTAALANYDYKHSFVVDKELNAAAMVAEFIACL